MSDLNERPAVPPQERGADERYGGFVAGSLLIVLGWGLGLLLNWAVHRSAGSAGVNLGVVTVHATFGPFAQATALLGSATGLVGAVLLYYASRAPKGPFVLPGTPY